LGLAAGSVRITPGVNRRLRLFATAQIAFSFVLLAAAGTLVAALIALQAAPTGYQTRQVLVIDVPTPTIGVRSDEEMNLYREMVRRIRQLPEVQGVALGNFVPWRDAGRMGPGFRFGVEGYAPADGE